MLVRSPIAFLLLLAIVTGARADRASKTFENWRVHCRSDGYCVAVATLNQTDSAALHIGRPAEETYWEMGLHPTAIADPHDSFTASAAGKSFSFAQPQEVASYGALNDYYLMGPAAQRLMDLLVHTGALTLGFTDLSGGHESATFPLGGLAEALLWIDTRQHRLGSERVVGPPPVGLSRVTLEAVTAGGGAPSAGPPLAIAGTLSAPVMAPPRQDADAAPPASPAK